MSGSFFKTSNFSQSFFSFFYFILLATIFICLFAPLIFFSAGNNSNSFVWPLPEYTYISSYFGHRTSPTSGASTYHSGIDIPAPEGTPILSVCSGEVTFCSWGAGGGYTIVVQNNALSVSASYCHVSPNFIVSRGDQVQSNQVISYVGPKNVYDIVNNPYHDSYGNPTNGATTGCHLHLTIKKDGKAVNPLDYFDL